MDKYVTDMEKAIEVINDYSWMKFLLSHGYSFERASVLKKAVDQAVEAMRFAIQHHNEMAKFRGMARDALNADPDPGAWETLKERFPGEWVEVNEERGINYPGKRLQNWIMETDSPNNMDHVIDMMVDLIKYVKNHTDPENMPQNIRITMKPWDEMEGDKEYVIEWE